MNHFKTVTVQSMNAGLKNQQEINLHFEGSNFNEVFEEAMNLSSTEGTGGGATGGGATGGGAGGTCCSGQGGMGNHYGGTNGIGNPNGNFKETLDHYLNCNQFTVPSKNEGLEGLLFARISLLSK